MENFQTLPLHKIEQFINNVKIIEEMARPKPNIEILKQYKGFGGLKNCFWDKQLYGQIMRAIRVNFGADKEKEVLEALRHTTKSAYYTPKEVIKFMYRYLEQVCGFTCGDILEPSCGNGAFFEYMPENIKQGSRITAVEYDVLTSKLVKNIYPDIKLINNGLQNIDFGSHKYDLIIGNPPYSDEKMTDKFMPDLSGYTIHHYFTAKCMRLLKDNGILAFVLPSYYMDIPRANTRHIIDNESVVIDVIRLPDNLFEQATVTVDLVMIRRQGNKIHNIRKTVTYRNGEGSDQINEFWIKNPHKIMGDLSLKWVQAYNRYVPVCSTADKQKVLNYLENCSFDKETIANYQNIIAAQSNQITAVKPKLTKELINRLQENFLEIKKLEGKAVELTKQLRELYEKGEHIIKELNALYIS